MKLKTASAIASILLFVGLVLQVVRTLLPGLFLRFLEYGSEPVSKEIRLARLGMVGNVTTLLFYYAPCLLFFLVLYFQIASGERGRR